MKSDRVFGIHAVCSLMDRDPSRIRKLFTLKGRENGRIEALIEKARAQGISVETINKQKLDERADGVHQGVLAEVKPGTLKGETDLDLFLSDLPKDKFILVLDGVTDPHNLGACIRTADAAGVDAVIAPRDRSAPLNSTASKVACGAAETIPYFQVTNLVRTLKQLQESGVWIVGTAGEVAESIYSTDLSGPVALVMGAEGRGIRRLTRENCDCLINIPMAGDVSSLNVSVATGIALFEVVRQRFIKTPA